MADDIALASLSLTHVYYDPNDPISYLCAWLALVPQALCIVYVTLIWSTREAEVALMFAGQLACEAVNFVLKRLIKEERPQRIHRTGKGYGMPSSHAQFVAFWAVAMALFLLVRHTPSWTDHGYGPRRTTTANGGSGNHNHNNNNNGGGGRGRNNANAAGARRAAIWGQDWVVIESYAHRPWSFVERAAASLAVLSVAAMVAWSRVYLGYHTVNQVLVGCLAGSLSALAWYGVTYVIREIGLLAWVLESPVARGLRIRDLVVSEDLAQAGWEKWEDRKVAAAAAQSSNKKK
ncbi:Putative dolichyldiphosphatase [Cytospora mali]|uniref:Dolichyldiphosphatase n=1 Tax=Cytospora mali TaxID=578113 RepID=A0A194UYJ4_CYTMA|nr:Putative dolichyldiphosphatase [Valsa mali var. pyri (nom. inval.)]